MGKERDHCLDKGGPEGRYANYFEVGHNAVEFLLDFGQLYPGDQHARLHSRIVTAPAYAKNLLKTLKRSVEQYETTFGVVSAHEERSRDDG